MLSIVLLIVCGGVVLLASQAMAQGPHRQFVVRIAMAGYLLRLLAATALRDVSFFSHDGGGDSGQYQNFASYLCAYWERAGVHWVESGEQRNIMDSGTIVSAPGFVHVFALIQYVDGDKTRFGMVAINAMLGCLTFVLMHRFCLDLGSRAKPALYLALAFYFSPAFLFYTADSYKDPWVIAFGLACVYGCYQVAERSVVRGLVIFLTAATLLWFTRRYLLYMMSLAVGVALVLRLVKKGKNRAIAISLSVFVAIGAAAVLPSVLGEFGENAIKTYDVAIDTKTRDWNEKGGSGVDFDDGGDPYARIGPKLAYTLFAPFPWMSGSVGFHVGKVDALLMTFAIFRAAVAVKRRWKDKRREILLLMAFIIPASLVYSLTMANIGLILRQRLVIECALIALASIGFVDAPARKEVKRRLPAGLRPRAPQRPELATASRESPGTGSPSP